MTYSNLRGSKTYTSYFTFYEHNPLSFIKINKPSDTLLYKLYMYTYHVGSVRMSHFIGKKIHSYKKKKKFT
jgi:hypothetical protein